MRDYLVVVLGGRGSGKTVFLASMANKLTTPGYASFYLGADPMKQRNLNNIYHEMAYKLTWPPATGEEIYEWPFQVKVSANDGKTYSICQMRYIDYSGAKWMEDGTGNADDELFNKYINQADCLLGLLDGEKLLNFLKGEDHKGKLHQEILTISQDALRSEKRAPVHYLISKWDLFDNQYTLEAVRGKLLEIEAFENVIQQRARWNNTVRLIPVSSVGYDFAQRNPEGFMRIVAGKLPQPVNVEMPFACVLPDAIGDELKMLVERKTQLANTQIHVDPNLSLWDRLILLFGNITKNLPSKYRLPDGILQQIAETAQSSVQQKIMDARMLETERRHALVESLAKVSDEATAFEHAMRSFLSMQQEFERKFPASKL